MVNKFAVNDVHDLLYTKLYAVIFFVHESNLGYVEVAAAAAGLLTVHLQDRNIQHA
jgi:hypothetical protein